MQLLLETVAEQMKMCLISIRLYVTFLEGSFRLCVVSLTVRSVSCPPAGQGALHPLHKGAAVQRVVSGSHAAVQRAGPGGRGHSAASRSRLPGHTSQHRPVQLGEVQRVFSPFSFNELAWTQ